MQRWTYEEGLEQGRAERLALLVHQFERRLGRPLAPCERDTLAERVRAQGAEQVGDLVLDLSAEDLATWLDEPNEP
ncbi:hypothetical protein [Polyangium aurulentum]|uniref:hypothetical protein n=1 Tax=Polyangium aurulentum TaxID=2567896 RepID=UPI0010AEDEDB|nr:hypothetical protein [Polyangium aurulentum]UQA58378.1 hypothetical protein E8A73_045230 [Polyangium aurulentum]